MGLWRQLLFRWVPALLYVAICFALILIFPVWLRPWLLGAYLIFLAWEYWSLEAWGGKEYKVRPLNRWELAAYPALRKRLAEACREMGLKREPYWAVTDDEIPNAIAIGGRRGLVVLTTGLCELLDPEEIMAIVGHELKHLANRDSLPAIIGGALLGLVGRISHWLHEVAYAGEGTMLAAIAIVLGAILRLSLMLVSWLGSMTMAHRSRYEEHLADLAGARLTSVAAMTGALGKLEEFVQKRHDLRPKQHAPWSPAWISERLHASHPPHDVRVAFLKAAAERGELRAS